MIRPTAIVAHYYDMAYNYEIESESIILWDTTGLQRLNEPSDTDNTEVIPTDYIPTLVVSRSVLTVEVVVAKYTEHEK